MTPSSETITAWARLVRAHDTILNGVEAALKAAGLPPLAWYDVLLELERAGTPLRPGALEGELLLAQYNLSRLLDRMAAAGVISRAPDPSDGRGRLVSLTQAGRDLRARMWPVYSHALQRAVGDRLTAGEAEALAGLLARLIPK